MAKDKVLRVRISAEEDARLRDMSHGSVPDFVRERLFSVESPSVLSKESAVFSEDWRALIHMLPDNFLDELAQRSGSRNNPAIWASHLWNLLRVDAAILKNGGGGDSPVKVQSEGNPYKGWWVEPAPDGSVKGYLDENTNKYMKVITDGKKYVKLFEDNPLYNEF